MRVLEIYTLNYENICRVYHNLIPNLDGGSQIILELGIAYKILKFRI